MKYKILIIFILLLSIFITIKNIQYTRADSGWDVSYDSGSSSYSDSTYSDDSDGGESVVSLIKSLFAGELSPEGIATLILDVLLIVVILSVVIVPIFYIIISSIITEVRKLKIKNNDNTIFNKYEIDKSVFLKLAFDKYVQIQEAWMNFDYDSLKSLLTNELYNAYYYILEILKQKNQRNIISNIEEKESRIIDIKKSKNILSVSVYLNVVMCDYLVNYENVVVRGSKDTKIDIKYEITFIKYLDSNSIKSCQNCGNVEDFVMSRKKIIGQRVVK